MTKITVDLPPAPKGYEYTGEYRKALDGETYSDPGWVKMKPIVVTSAGTTSYPYFILRRVRWRAHHGQPYYYIILGYGQGVHRSIEDSLDLDDKRHALGNYFKTREEAEEKAKALYQLLQVVEAEEKAKAVYQLLIK